ncbi:HAD hydrolase family protein [Endozoicomonas euniceicola]|uniref:HAD hydrolase family protein n=2 Tax=Endozoicomonas euniceicola TaxID=1234143 RepID=A0ABY6H177_9GAMM|nr:HAD hydrolase family protein [Endozoicomonas euniceicola]UYM18820.1 HAD hydrolase family protein [Endozoicomonas euniceicola]
MKKIVIDLDGTITHDSAQSYDNKPANQDIIAACKKYKEQGFSIVIHTSRNMRTYDGNVGKINIHTLPGIIAWLEKHDVPYDEIHVGKPWCGFDGFYVDDKAIRPSEFASMSYEEIQSLLAKENPYKDGGNA